ncbi:hypothetical protein GCM10009119_29970 [Algoriphagus jejuensis]|uniref:Uncharacterized protein n=1 Tax=Algoriphagus jejuensis TaxID=419934 RepID=A0ABP3YFR6_9BACT
MITHEKLRIFEKYNGDTDGFARTGKKSEKEIFDTQDWLLIDSMVQDLELIKNGLCSKKFELMTFEKLNDIFDSKSIEMIKNKIF